jgi:alpha-glucosidase (family GH31 glycosyl hydrolase)
MIMRAAIFLVAISIAQAGVVSRDWANGTLALQLNDGIAEIEYISETAFRFSRGVTSLPVLPKIAHDPVVPQFEDSRTTLKLNGRHLSIEIEKATAILRVTANNEAVTYLAIEPSADGLALHLTAPGRTYGLAGPGDSQRFFFATGYGIFVRAPRELTFNLHQGAVNAPGSKSMEAVFYYGPTPKEIFEQHQAVTGRTEVTAQSLYVRLPDQLPAAASPLPNTPIDSWETLAQLVRTLDQWSLSGVLYPALDVATFSFSRGELARRAADLAEMLPLIYGDRNILHFDMRDRWAPYLATYLREAYDRGYPLIRPFPVEFSREKDLDPQPGIFMLGDEVLLAPVVAPGPRRELKLPRGTWTDLRTDAIYKGNQSVEVEAPPGQVPAFARNGALLPIATKNAMELHYFPDLGGEFFLWESDKRENSQFHAAPAGEFTRVEIESQVARTYEWVIHHTNRPANVQEGETAYKQVKQRSALKPGMWWQDDARNDLHVMVRAEAGTDRIVNISF